MPRHSHLNPRPSAYATLIAEATGAHPMELPIIEKIMRDLIFHSTLDWQSKDQFNAGAREAYEEYQSRKAFYDAEFKVNFLSFQLAKAQAVLADICAKLERAKAAGKADRIARCEAEADKRQTKVDALAERVELWKQILARFREIYA